MVDHISPERRSWLMSRVASKHTTPEMRVRRAAHAMGLRFRLHRKNLPGKPDLIFPKYGIAIFVHGCFWHRHAGCAKASMPKSRPSFWAEKFKRNQERDAQAERVLKSLGWTVHTIWECQTKDDQTLLDSLKEMFGKGRRDD